MRYPRADVAAVTLGIAVVAIVSAIFVVPLPSARSFLDGLGRYMLMVGLAAAIIAFVASRESRTLWNIVQGSFAIAFYGAIVGLVINGLFGWLSKWW